MTATATTEVRCGNTAVHGPARVNGTPNVHHHCSVAEVRACFTTPGGLLSVEDEYSYGHEAAQAQAEFAAEQANERYFEERGGGTYAGSEEEARDRYMDSLTEEAQRASEAAYEPQSFVEAFTAARAAEAGAETAPVSPEVEGVDWAATATAEPPAPPAPAVEAALLDGTYSLPHEGGHRTFRLRTQAKDAPFAPGKRVLQYLSGPDNSYDYTGFAFVHGTSLKVWKKFTDNAALVEQAKTLLADPAQALVAAECRRCHRPLTVPSSIDAGLGPECAKKEGS
jgi:hypothetical protein